MHSSAHFQTTQASRIAKRLLNHWKHKFEVAESSDQLQIMMPTATISLIPQVQALLVHIQLQDTEADLTRLEQVVLDHLIRMGQEPLTAIWQRH